jgi:hypothetical protein
MDAIRREFIERCGGVAVAASLSGLPTFARAQPRPQFAAFSDRVPNLIRPRMRQLTATRRPYLSDQVILRQIEEWLRQIRLGQQTHAVNVNRDNIFQFTSVRPDVHSYVVHITDAASLWRIVDIGRRKNPRFEKWWTANRNKVQLGFGSLHWLRHIVPNVPNKTKKQGKFLVREIYWLIAWRKVDDLYVPAVHVGDEFVTFARPRLPWREPRVLEKVAQAPTRFLDPQLVLLPWHKVATAFQLASSIPYLRACFTSADFGRDIWSRDAQLDNTPLPPSRAGSLIYTPTGIYGQNANTYQMPITITDPTRIRPGIHRVGDLRLAPAGFNVRDYIAARIPELQNLSAAWPQAMPPAPKDLRDQTNSGKEFIVYTQLMSRRAAYYVGRSHFGVGVQLPQIGAARSGTRASAYAVGVEEKANSDSDPSIGDIQDAITLGSETGSTIAKNILESSDRYGDQLRRLKENIKVEAQACAVDWNNYDDCVDCIEKAGDLGEAEQLMEEMSYWQGFGSVAGGAAYGCAMGAAATVFGGPTAAVGCAVGAIVGAVIGLGHGVEEYYDQQVEIDKMRDEAFSGCREKMYT